MELRPCPNMELRRCPNTACECKGCYVSDDEKGTAYVVCITCNLEGPVADTEDKAAALWNALPRESDMRRIADERIAAAFEIFRDHEPFGYPARCQAVIDALATQPEPEYPKRSEVFDCKTFVRQGVRDIVAKDNGFAYWTDDKSKPGNCVFGVTDIKPVCQVAQLREG